MWQNYNIMTEIQILPCAYPFFSRLHPHLRGENSISKQMHLFCRIRVCLQWQFLPREQGSTWEKWMLETIWVSLQREEGSSASMTVQLHLHGRHRVLSVLWVMSHFVYEMTHSAVQIPGVNTKRRNQHPGLLWLIMTSCAWLRAFKRPPEFFYRATLICTWPFYQHLLSVNIKPGEYTGLTAWGIAIWTHIH